MVSPGLNGSRFIRVLNLLNLLPKWAVEVESIIIFKVGMDRSLGIREIKG